MSTIDLQRIITSAHCDSPEKYRPLGLGFDVDPYLISVSLDFFTECEDGPLCLDMFEEEIRVRKTATVKGTLILGRQLSFDGNDLFLTCDVVSGDLGYLAEELIKEGIESSEIGDYRNILYIDSIEMESDLVEASNLRSFFDVLPQVIFEWYYVKPDMMCYIIAINSDYYEQQASATELDPRAVDGYSPLIFTDNGFRLSRSGNVLYQITEGWTLPVS